MENLQETNMKNNNNITYLKTTLFNSLLAILLIICGCSIIYPENIPIPSIWYHLSQEKSDTLIIFLPGRGDRADEFQKQGFIDDIRKAGISADAVSVDAHTGYYYRRTLLDRLYNDIILPARAKGYRNIWITGISMGGIGSLLYAKHFPETIQGIFLIAPFLGDKEVIDEIETAGGLANWQPDTPIKQEDYQRQLWNWLKNHTLHNDRHPLIAIGWGREDQFARANSLLADVLPVDRVFITSGRHNWEPWKKIWHSFLKTGIIQ